MLIGVDEAGRGPLAGNVCAAAVILDPSKPILGLADSKKLTAKKRDELYDLIIANSYAYHISYASVAEIDQLNILQATLLAMSRAILPIQHLADEVIVDGNKTPPVQNIKISSLVRGDSLIEAISAASILAKVTRDRECFELDRLYPEYGFAAHKGYGTKQHVIAINQYGLIPGIHRTSFKLKSQQDLF